MKSRNKLMICGALLVVLGYEVHAIYTHDIWKSHANGTVVNNDMTTTSLPPITVKKPTKKPIVTTSYKDDKLWSQWYSKRGDRSIRYAVVDTQPGFKAKYLKWKGKEYCPTNKLLVLVESVLKRMPHINSNDYNVVRLVAETAIAESQGGYFTSSANGDYGMFQIRTTTARSLLEWLRDNHRDVYDAINKFRNSGLSLEDNLQHNVPFGIAMCVSEYWRKAGPELYKYIISLEDRAKLWKSVYNTKHGKGTVNAYLSRNTQYVASK